jgi:TPR repeat protein
MSCIKNIHDYSCASLNNLGLQYEKNGDHELMKMCFLVSIQKGSINAMVHLGNYYYKQRKTKKMFLYYHMAIEQHSDVAMENLGTYYYSINDYDNMKKYYKMATDHNNPNAERYLIQYKDTHRIKLWFRHLIRCLIKSSQRINYVPVI